MVLSWPGSGRRHAEWSVRDETPIWVSSLSSCMMIPKILVQHYVDASSKRKPAKIMTKNQCLKAVAVKTWPPHSRSPDFSIAVILICHSLDHPTLAAPNLDTPILNHPSFDASTRYHSLSLRYARIHRRTRLGKHFQMFRSFVLV